MQITRQADYAVRAVLYLAGLHNGRRAPTSEIAREQRIPPSFLAKIVSQLSVAGVVQTWHDISREDRLVEENLRQKSISAEQFLAMRPGQVWQKPV